MPDYRLTIIVEGRDQASGPLGNVQGALGRIGEIAIGGALALGLAKIGQAIGGLAADALNSAAEMQNLTVALETLAAREIVMAGGAETVSEALDAATPIAAGLLEQLRSLSLTSPFQYQQVADVFRLNMAFGATSESAMALTQATLDTGSALGLTGVTLDRLTWNLAQALQAGDLTAINLRQLRMVGLDLADVFQKELGLSVEELQKRLKSGELTMEEVSLAFVQYAEKNFGGAAKRMSRTFTGVQSSVKDLFFFAGADLLTPALEKVTEAAGGLFDQARGFLEGGGFAQLGEQLGNIVGLFLAGDFGGMVQALGLGPEVETLILNVVGLLTEVGTVIWGVLGPALTWLQTDGLALLMQAIASVNEHWEAFKAALIAIGAVLAGAAIAGAIVGIVGVIASLANPITLIAGAVGLLAAAWTEDWGGIRTTLTAFWEETAKPALEALWGWLSTNIPLAIQAVAGFWTGTLQPALQTVWEFIQNSVIPIFQEIGTWLSTNIPPIIQGMAALWTGTLLPALETVWGFIQDPLLPLFGAVGEVLGAVLGKAVEALAGLWQNVLQPALQTVWEWLAEKLQPIFQAIGDFVEDFLLPVLEKLGVFFRDVAVPIIGGFVRDVLDKMKTAFENIKEALQPVIDFLRELADKIENLELPDWLTPGSPTPFQLGLEGIAGVLQGVMSEALVAFSTLMQAVLSAFGALLEGCIGLLAIMTQALDDLATITMPALRAAAITTLDTLKIKLDAAEISAQTLKAAFVAIKNALEAIDPSGLVTALEGLATTAEGAAVRIVEAFVGVGGVKEALQAVNAVLRDMIDYLGQVEAAALAAAAALASLTVPAPPGAYGKPYGASGQGPAPAGATTVGGDTFYVNIHDSTAAGLFMQWADMRRRQRLNEFMGG